MDLELRFGMHRDVELIHESRDLIEGLVIPAHILAYQTPSTSAFVTSLPDENYVIDPMTFIFQNPRRHHKSDSNPSQLRPSVGNLCDEYHQNLRSIVNGNENLSATDLPNLNELSTNATFFQLNAVQEGSELSAANKYLKRYDLSRATRPSYVLPPYFRFENVEDPWYHASLACAQATADLELDVPVAPVICCPIDVLATSRDSIVEDYSQFSSVYFWIDNYHERKVSRDDINVAEDFISSLAGTFERVATLYGGYLLLVLGRNRLDSLSHGILYTQHKSYRLSPGSGGPIERYYIPDFHQFRSLSQTDLIIHQHPELMCGCKVCKKVLAGEPDNIFRYGEEPELLRKHFLTVRREEADSVNAKSDEELVEQFQRTYGKYHASVSQLPNPDAPTSDATQRGLGYLQEWARALA